MITLLVLRRCLALLWLPFLLLTGVTTLLLWLVPPIESPGNESFGRALALWLHLPTFGLAVAGLTAWLESWPMTSRDRPGACWLRRLHLGPLAGSGKAALTGLLLLAFGLVILALLFQGAARVAGLPATKAHVSLQLANQSDNPVLGRRQPRMQWRTNDSAPLRQLRLTPFALMQRATSNRTPMVRLLADGIPLHDAWQPVLGSWTVQLQPPRSIQQLTLERRQAGGIPLLFEAGSIRALAAQPHSDTLNAVLAALFYLCPLSLAMALVLTSQRWLSLPVGWSVGFGALVVTSLFDIAPHMQAITAYSRGHWLGTLPWLQRALPSLAITAALWLTAWMVNRKPQRV